MLSNMNCTPTTPTLSELVVEIGRRAGDRCSIRWRGMATVGFVVSGRGRWHHRVGRPVSCCRSSAVRARPRSRCPARARLWSTRGRPRLLLDAQRMGRRTAKRSGRRARSIPGRPIPTRVSLTAVDFRQDDLRRVRLVTPPVDRQPVRVDAIRELHVDRVVVGVGGLQAHPQVIGRICRRVERDVDVVLGRRERGVDFRRGRGGIHQRDTVGRGRVGHFGPVPDNVPRRHVCRVQDDRFRRRARVRHRDIDRRRCRRIARRVPRDRRECVRPVRR